jgi:two-component system chemotaxis sensor kinase CheA
MDDLIGEFITETTESLSLLDSELVKFEQNPNDEKILGNIFRIVHTIKGTCGFLGLPRLQAVAHASENVLGKIRDKKLDASAQAISLVLASLDSIKVLVDHLSQNGSEPEGSDSELIDRLNQFAEGKAPNGSAGEPHAAAPVANGANGAGGDMTHFFKGDDELNAMIAKENGAEAPAANGDMTHFFKGDDELNAMIAKENGTAAPAANGAGGDMTHFFKGDDELNAMIAKENGAAAPAAQQEKPAEEKAPAPKAEPVAAAPKAAEKAEAKDANKDGGGATQSIRVNLDVLENLMQMVSELVLTRNQLMQIARTRKDRDFVPSLQQLSHITTELQEGVMKTRMQPIGNAWSKFPRLVRDLSLELGKKIDLKMVGAETELDRQLLELIKDPLTHMVRNSCDHGLEMPADRRTTGKSETGTVTLSASHEGGYIVIDIADDGRGLNVARIKEKAITNGLATAAQLAAMSDSQIMRFIFAAGFSTAEKVTAVSGRGVGMDVVRTNIEKMGGTIEISSVQGRGSKFSIKIPLTLAIVPVLIVEDCGEKFAIPQINVMELIRVTPKSEFTVEKIHNALVVRLREKLLPLISLGEVLQLRTEVTDWTQKEFFVAVCKVGNSNFGVIVERIHDTEEIVVKPVADALKSIPLYSGNTILGNGSVIMILDPLGLTKAISNTQTAEQQTDIAHVPVKDSAANFLLVSIGEGSPKAVPLDLVSRLEKIDVKDIEIVGDKPVIQYRGELMKLIRLDETAPLPEEDIISVIVFNYDKKVIGLVVDSIVDIVRGVLDVKLPSQQKHFLGSMVINGKTTEIVDVAYLLSSSVGMVDLSQTNIEQAKKVNILFVEDSPFFRNLTQPFLSAVGYKVTAAENGSEALKIIDAHPEPFDAIVTDIEMPVMNGFELAAACRSNSKMSQVPIIAYTSTLNDEILQKGKVNGMTDCIHKTDRPGLLEAITRHLAAEKRVAA